MVKLKPKPHFTPNVKRTAERKRMTICIGMLASDGIVIAADSQESDTYFKRGQQKILTLHTIGLGSGPHPPPSGCVITGAGDAGFIDSFTQKLLLSIKGDMTIQTFQAYLENEVAEFYERHIVPILSSTPETDFQMLVGVYFGFASALFKTYRSTVQKVMPSAAIGASTFGMMLLEAMPPVSDVRSTEIIAANVIATTKDCIEGCGKYTDIVSIHNCIIVEGTRPGEGAHLEHPPYVITRVPASKIARWEKSFGGQWARKQHSLLQELINQERENDEVLERAERFKRLDSQTLEGQQ